MARLIFGTPNGERAIELQPKNGLGRHPGNSLQLMDKIASKEHCVIEQRGTQYLLRDLGSLNGTFINGERVNGERMLRHGDEIELGMTRARYDDGYSPRTYPKLPISPEVVANRGSDRLADRSSPGAPPPPMGRSATPVATPTPTPAPLSYSSAGHTSPRNMAPSGQNVEMNDAARRIGHQVDVRRGGFLPFDQVERNPQQLRNDYESLRMIYELSKAIGVVHDLDKLMRKVLGALFHFVPADRGVILLIQPDSTLKAAVSYRRDGSSTPIKVSSTIIGHVIREKKGVLTQDAAQDFASSNDGRSMMLNRISSAIVVPLLHEDDLLGAVWLDSEMLNQFKQKDLELVQAVASQAAMFIANALLSKQVEKEIVTRERFSRLLSPNVAEQVISGKLDIKQGGVSVRECSVFNSDIRGFTRLAEGMPPDVLLDLLNEYFEVMVEIVFRYEGTLDKFMGDGIMAFWGAPVAHPDNATRAVRCAVEQMDALSRFNRERSVRGAPSFEMGIGIHTGPLVAGYVGSSKALGYTVIGDTANTSARLCSIAQPNQIVISEQTADIISGQFRLEELPPAQLKGKDRPIRIFNVRR
jgi:adenylate cyclase